MKNLKVILTFALIFATTLSSFAQGPGFVDDVDDVAPIPGIVMAIISAICIGVYSLRNKRNS